MTQSTFLDVGCSFPWGKEDLDVKKGSRVRRPPWMSHITAHAWVLEVLGKRTALSREPGGM
jgi:hypothetical protein